MIKAVPWQQGAIKIFGKEIPEPRLTMYYGDESYKYSGRLLAATPWTRAPALVTEAPGAERRVPECCTFRAWSSEFRTR